MNENVNVCITPKGDKPVLHFSQFDNENVFTVTVLADDGESAAVLTGLDIEFRLRKTDSHVVTIAPESVADNVITFKTTEQLCACCGQNIATVTLMKDDMIVSTLDILVDIQRDILSGGLTSESDIRNLTTQIEQIVPEVIGDDYYNKQEVDDLLAEHTFDPTNYYNKSDVDGLLADKADSDDVYTKSDVDGLLDDKADADDVYTKTETDNLLMDRMGNIEFTALTPGTYPVISFNSSYNAPIIDIEAEITSSTNTINLVRTGKNKFNDTTGPHTINANTDVTLVIGDIFLEANTTYTISCKQTPAPLTSFVRNTLYIIGGGTTTYNPAGNDYTIKPMTFTPTVSGTYNIRVWGHTLSADTTYSEFQVETGSQATSFEPYNYQVKTITLDTTVSSGSIDFAHGTITDSGTVIKFTPVTLDAVVGENNIYIDVGDMTSLTYVSQADLGLMALLEAYTLR